MKSKKAFTLKTQTKSSVWGLNENDVFRMLDEASKELEFKENLRHYVDTLKSAFEIEKILIDKPVVITKYKERDYKIGTIKLGDGVLEKWAIKKRNIQRITDLTTDNIHHISATQLVGLLERNFGGGWDSISPTIQAIILTRFDVSSTTLPTERLHKPGGMYEKKNQEGYEILEIPKGNWTEAIFVQQKPEQESILKDVQEDDWDSSLDMERAKYSSEEDILDEENDLDDSEEQDDEDNYDDLVNEEIYRTQIDDDSVELSDDISLEADDDY